MKYIINNILFSLLLLTSPIFLAAQKNDSFNLTIKGKFKHIRPVSMIIILIPQKKDIIDSVKIINNEFEFKTTINEPTLSYIWLRTTKTPKERENTKAYFYVQTDSVYNRDLLQAYLEPGVFKIKGDSLVSTAKVKGSRSHKEWEEYYKIVHPIEQVIFEENQEFIGKWKRNEIDSVVRAAYFARSDGMKAEVTNHKLQFIKTHPNSFVSLNFLMEWIGDLIDYNLVQPLFESFSAELKNSPGGKMIADRLTIASRMQPGFAFTDFTQTDNNGNLFQLSSLKGKYILVNFSVSWNNCKLCHDEIPLIKEAFKNYHEKGFEIVNVSLDSSKQAWLNSIEKDSLNGWHHVSDLKGWKNEVAKLYGILGIPQNILINPEGMIIASNLRGDALEKKLAELLAK